MLFKHSETGDLIFNERSRWYHGKSAEEVAEIDPNYLRFARRVGTFGLPVEDLDAITEIMTRHHISIIKPRPKRNP